MRTQIVFGLAALIFTSAAWADSAQPMFFAKSTSFGNNLEVHCEYVEQHPTSPDNATALTLHNAGGRVYTIALPDNQSAYMPSDALRSEVNSLAATICPASGYPTARAQDRSAQLNSALSRFGGRVTRTDVEQALPWTYSFNFSRGSNECSGEDSRVLRNIVGAEGSSRFEMGNVGTGCARLGAQALDNGIVGCLLGNVAASSYCSSLFNLDGGMGNTEEFSLAVQRAYRGGSGCHGWNALPQLHEMNDANQARLRAIFGSQGSTAADAITSIRLINERCGALGNSLFIGMGSNNEVTGSSRHCEETWVTDVGRVLDGSISRNDLQQLCGEVRAWRQNYYRACHINTSQHILDRREAPASLYNARLLACRCQYYITLGNEIGRRPSQQVASQLNAAPFGGYIPAGDKCDAYINPFSNPRTPNLAEGTVVTKQTHGSVQSAR